MFDERGKYLEVRTEGDFRKGTWKCPHCGRSGGTIRYSIKVAPSDDKLLKRAEANLRLHLQRCKEPTNESSQMKRQQLTLNELRVIVREELLRELEGGDSGGPGGGSGMGWGGNGPMGAGYGFMNYGGSLADIFIKPFTDVIATTKGVATELTARAKAAIQVGIEVILSSLIPLYQTNYTAIFKQMDKSLGEIKKKYEKVYQANAEAFQDKDARFIAFLYDPSAWITAKTVGASPAAAANVLEIFTDGASGAGTHLLEAIRYLKELEMELKGVSRYNRNVTHRLRKQAHSNSHIMPWESKTRGTEPILEAPMQAPATQPAQAGAPQKNPAQDVAAKMQKILSDPELKKEIAQSPTAQAMRADGQALLSQVTSQLSKDIQSANAVSSLADIEKMGHGRVKMPDLSQLQPQEKQQAEAAAVGQTKQALSAFYQKSLEGAIRQAQTEGIGNDNAYIRTLQGLLSKVGK